MNLETYEQLPKPVIKDEPIIHVENLNLRYGKHHVLANINLPIKKGAITTLIGPSGSGKTSFLICLNRLVDMVTDRHVSGAINYGPKNILDADIDVISLRRNIGMIFQKPNPFPISIWKNIETPLREHGFRDKRIIAEIIEGNLRDVGLWDEIKDRLHYSALRLSGGQQQRLCIARALALKPEILLMDEPCSALDPISSGVIEDLIKKLRGHYTVFVVTHNLAQAKRIGDYTALFWVQKNSGYLIEYGTTNQIFNRPGQKITLSYISGERG